jgi:hypothetical protein
VATHREKAQEIFFAAMATRAENRMPRRFGETDREYADRVLDYVRSKT